MNLSNIVGSGFIAKSFKSKNRFLKKISVYYMQPEYQILIQKIEEYLLKILID